MSSDRLALTKTEKTDMKKIHSTSIKLWLCSALLLLLSLTVGAQEYTVYRVRGEVSLVVKQKASPLVSNQRLDSASIISLNKGSELKLVTMKTQEMVTLRGQCAGSLRSLIAQQSGSRQKMTAQYMQFVLKNMRGEGYNAGQQAGRSTTIYREGDDDLFAPIPDSLMVGDSLLMAPPPPPDSIRMPVLVLSPTFMAADTHSTVATPQPRLSSVTLQPLIINIQKRRHGHR